MYHIFMYTCTKYYNSLICTQKAADKTDELKKSLSITSFQQKAIVSYVYTLHYASDSSHLINVCVHVCHGTILTGFCIRKSYVAVTLKI